MYGSFSQLPYKCHLEEVASSRWHLWEIDLRCALNSTPGWIAREWWFVQRQRVLGEIALRRKARRAELRSQGVVWGDLATLGNPGATLKSISHRCYLFEVAFVWELTKETIVLPMGCLQGGIWRVSD